MKRIVLGGVFLTYLVFAFIYSRNVIPKGDEVHYLLMVKSIVVDHDIWLENNYINGDLLSINPEVLDKIAVKGLDGHEYLVHGIGFTFLLAPFYAIGGRTAIVFFHTLTTFLLFLATLSLSTKITNSKKISLFITSAIFLSTPIFNFSVLSFPEVMGALVVIISFSKIFFEKSTGFITPLSLALLPWLHVRFLLLSIILFIFWFFLNQKKSYTKLSIYLIIVILFFVFLKLVFGSVNPYRPFELLGDLPLQENILVNLINSFIDRQYGLFVYSPLFIFLIPGLHFWYKENKKIFFPSMFLVMIYILPILRSDDWQGGYTPPARYLVAILPLVIPAIVFFFKYNRGLKKRFLASTFYAWGTINMIISLFLTPNHGFLYRDGVSPNLWFLYINTGINLHKVFPAYYPKQSLSFLHLAWLVLILCLVLILLTKKKVLRRN